MAARSAPPIDNDVYDRLAETWWDENGLLNLLKEGPNTAGRYMGYAIKS